jgi:diguanylate cyclase (GGDEF)-like protein
VLAIFDIDRFKRINDAHGHLAGDTVIQAVSASMTKHLGSLGLVCRLGGEEFALLSSTQRTEDILDAVWSFRDHVAAAPIVVGDVSVNVTISAGVATRAAGESFNQLYADADRALYMAKAAGRNRVNFAETFAPPTERRSWRSEPLPPEASDDASPSRSVA